MSNIDIQQNAIDTIIVMNKAIANLRLYPLTSVIIVNTIDTLEKNLLTLLEQESPLVYAESEKNILINGELLSKSDRERQQVKLFLELLFNMGIKSVTFERGMDREELIAFLQIMVKKPETIKSEGGLQKLMAEANLTNIIIDRKIYIAKDEAQQILAGLDINDDDIIKYMLGPDSESNLDLQKIKEMTKDTDWITQIFHSGMNHVMQQKESLSNYQVSENMIRMLSFLDKITDSGEQEKIAQLITKSLVDMDEEVISFALMQNIDSLFNGKIFQQILDSMDEVKFEGVVEKLQFLKSAIPLDPSKALIPDTDPFGKAYNLLMDSDKGRRLQKKREDKEALPKKEKQIMDIRDSIKPILNGDEKAFHDRSSMASLPNIAEQLIADNEYQTVDAMLSRLAEGLLNKNQQVRDDSSEALVRVMNIFTAEKQAQIVSNLLSTLIQWIKSETSATSAYEKICHKLKDQIAEFIREKKFTESIPVLDVFHRIASGVLDKNDTAHTIATDIIRELTAPEILDLLFKEFLEGDEKGKKEAGRVLGKLGETSLNRLLDILRDNDDSNERVRILHIFAEIGPPCIPVIRERLVTDEPWYFLRNIAYIMGRINSSVIAAALGPLLLHENDKVRQEAMKSLYRSGGSERGPVLLSLLEAAEESFKIDIIELLGNVKYLDAVPALIELLKTRPFIPSVTRIELEEKICVALGKIGSKDAIPILMEISKPKFFSRSTYADKVRAAAEKALGSIKR